MADDTANLVASLQILLPAGLTAEQRQRFAEIFAIVARTAERVPHATDEFAEPAPVFDLQIRHSPSKTG